MYVGTFEVSLPCSHSSISLRLWQIDIVYAHILFTTSPWHVPITFPFMVSIVTIDIQVRVTSARSMSVPPDSFTFSLANKHVLTNLLTSSRVPRTQAVFATPQWGDVLTEISRNYPGVFWRWIKDIPGIKLSERWLMWNGKHSHTVNTVSQRSGCVYTVVTMATGVNSVITMVTGVNTVRRKNCRCIMTVYYMTKSAWSHVCDCVCMYPWIVPCLRLVSSD